MKLNVLALSALLALAAAETTTTAEKSATTTLSPEAECAKNYYISAIDPEWEICNFGDTNSRCCLAKCYSVPCPSDNQAEDTNKCVSACPQGNGTLADTKKYTDCQQACFSSHFFPIDGSTATGSSGSGTTASGSQATETGSKSSSETGSKSSSETGSTNASGTVTGSSTGTTETGSAQTSNAANANIKLGASSAGLFGLVLAAFAL